MQKLGFLAFGRIDSRRQNQLLKRKPNIAADEKNHV